MIQTIFEHPHSKELLELDYSTEKLISAVRNEIQEVLNRNDVDVNFRVTVRKLCHYMSSRSQAITGLLRLGYHWDSEIIMRSFYESSAKIWFICFADLSNRSELVQEFWGLYASSHDHKRKTRVEPSLELSKAYGDLDDAEILATLQNPNVFPDGETNKRERRNLEQKWSFSEIVKTLSKDVEGRKTFHHANALLHMYGMQSHLLHADDAALGLMDDRAMRTPDIRDALEAAHAARMMSDQANLWFFSLVALRHAYKAKEEIPEALLSLSKINSKLSEEIKNKFTETQRGFYEGIRKRDR